MAIVSRARACSVLLLAATFTVQACDSPRVDGPPPVTVSLAKAASNPSVTSANPASGHQGDVTLDVTIIGSGFDSGSRAVWQLNGVAYSKIVVNSMRFNSSTSLTATITIAADAVVTNYDIAVITSTGKKGIGAEMFTVTYAVTLPGLTLGQAISDGGTVVGYNGTTVVATSLGAVVTIAANSTVWDIDRAGGTIGGQNAAQKPVIWTSSTGAQGSWVETVLPDLGGTMSAVRGIASDANGNAVFLAGNSYNADGKRRPVVWKTSETGWTIQENVVPASLPGIFAQSVNALGQSVGFDGSGCCTAAYWDASGKEVTRLLALTGARNAAAWSINGDGTIAVGNSGTSAVMWRRDLTNGTYSDWSPAIALENTATLCGKNGSSIAHDINTAGTIAVGSSCGVAVAWKIGASGAVPERKLLQGLGPPNQSVAYGISDAASPTATGSAKTSTAVYWWGF